MMDWEKRLLPARSLDPPSPSNRGTPHTYPEGERSKTCVQLDIHGCNLLLVPTPLQLRTRE